MFESRPEEMRDELVGYLEVRVVVVAEGETARHLGKGLVTSGLLIFFPRFCLMFPLDIQL